MNLWARLGLQWTLDQIQGVQMKYHIEKHNNGLDVEVWDVADCQPKVLEAFRMCQSGECTCPIAEYQKLDGLSLKTDKNRIALHLKVKNGEDIDDQAIKECLACTLGAAAKANSS